MTNPSGLQAVRLASHQGQQFLEAVHAQVRKETDDVLPFDVEIGHVV
jgi:hypothetical protein